MDEFVVKEFEKGMILFDNYLYSDSDFGVIVFDLVIIVIDLEALDLRDYFYQYY